MAVRLLTKNHGKSQALGRLPDTVGVAFALQHFVHLRLSSISSGAPFAWWRKVKPYKNKYSEWISEGRRLTFLLDKFELWCSLTYCKLQIYLCYFFTIPTFVNSTAFQTCPPKWPHLITQISLNPATTYVRNDAPLTQGTLNHTKFTFYASLFLNRTGPRRNPDFTSRCTY